MNWGKIAAWSNVVLCLCAAVGYFAVKDIRRGLYWTFAGAITAVITWS